MKRIADSTVRRLSAYLRFLEDFEQRGLLTISSEELAKRGGTTSAQVRKDLSFFGSFGKRGLGYSVPELAGRLREILGLGKEWRVVIVGAGKIGAALVQYRGFRQRGFNILAAYDNNPDKIGRKLEGIPVRDIDQLEKDISREKPDIVVLTVPGDQAQRIVDRVVKAGVKAILNFAPAQLQAPADVAVKTVNMAMELEGLSFALTNRD
ncbi:MAG TPA: redox-sensing transcriptional repressor Rex [Gemmatimonadaceae bacterium]|nr:redox-sensing transcriptional repressor Rex [Gemmatimonadaceae bacterium]